MSPERPECEAAESAAGDSGRPPQRRVRSFVRREGRLTPAQADALERLWPRYGLEPAPQPPDLDFVFGRRAPRTLEIGFGDGQSLLELAGHHPDSDFLGVEVHRPGVGRLLRRLEAERLDNVRVWCADAVEVLESQIPDAALAAVHLFFPDPWPKKRHHKRRLLQPDFAQLVRRKLEIGGVLHTATDWSDYAEHMRDVLEAAEGLVNIAGPGQYAPRPAYRPLTKFERRGQALGHSVWDLLYRREC